MHRNSVCQIFEVLFLLGLLVASCSSTTPQLTMPATWQETASPVTSQETISPATSSITLTPIITATMQSKQLTKTQTLAPLFKTDTPGVCPPFEIDTDLPDPDIPENYVGYHYGPHKLPQGLVDSGGSVVRSRNQQYELAIHEVDWQEDRQLIWLEKLICLDKSGHPYFEIVDSFATPSLLGNETEPWVCFDGETEVPFVGGLGLYDESVPKVTIGEYRGLPYTQILFLYDIDFVSQEFIMLDVDSLKCLEGGRP